MEYLRCFCAGDIDGLATLLTPDLTFRGTFHQYGSSAEYLESLRSDPPGKCGYRIVNVVEDGDSVAVFYDYEKPNRVITIAQLFTIANQKISEVLLVFDGRGFA
ncbi:MAG: nuclear transport factor 2 family protein [Thermodesulfobacteriota bacterium]